MDNKSSKRNNSLKQTKSNKEEERILKKIDEVEPLEDKEYMNIQLIGENMNIFFDLLSSKKIYQNNIKNEKEKTDIKTVEDFWKIKYSKNKDVQEQINEYFEKLFKIKNDNDNNNDNKLIIQLKETLIVKVENCSDQVIDSIFKKLEELREDYYMPIVIFLVIEDNKEIVCDIDKYQRANKCLIFTKKYSENKKYYENDDAEMKRLLIRCYSIHNELGDSFSIGKDQNKISYDLTKIYYPFNLNICCLGRFGQGKSTGVNVLLNEYKTKESSGGTSQTKKANFYQCSYAPIKILDVPGYDSEDNIQLSIDKFRYCAEEINRLKEYIHIFLYFLKNTDDRTISNFESVIFQELINYEKSKIIYVVTHSDKDQEEEDKNEYIKKINEEIKNLKIEDEKIKNLIIKNFKATEDNVVFVNFYKDLKLKREPFGKKELFKKIVALFKSSDIFKESNKILDPLELNYKIKILKEKENSILIKNKIGGALIGVIPVVDLLVQKFVIKKQIIRKIGGIFGIDVKYINNKENQKDKNQKEQEEIKIELFPPENKEPEYNENLDLKSELDMEIRPLNDKYNRKEEMQQKIDSEGEDNLIRASNVISKTSTSEGEAVIEDTSVAVSIASRIIIIGFLEAIIYLNSIAEI